MNTFLPGSCFKVKTDLLSNFLFDEMMESKNKDLSIFREAFINESVTFCRQVCTGVA